jgi:hypothetical protein
MTRPRGSVRFLVAIGLSIGLVAVACGSSGAGQSPQESGSGKPGAGTAGSALPAGLSANLDSLTSYQFTETLAGGASTAVPVATGPYRIGGTVINKPTQSYWVTASGGAQYTVIGSQAWTTYDGTSWIAFDASDLTLAGLLPAGNYDAWFDVYAPYFKSVGTESRNGIDCIHYQGDSSLASHYSATPGTTNLAADLWVARDGSYPVSGTFGFAGSFGVSFDITHVNDASNRVSQPTNIVSIPS